MGAQTTLLWPEPGAATAAPGRATTDESVSTKAPKVSILIPTYNYGRFLPEAIDSVLEQDFRDFELLISDDCSTDDSAEVIQTYTARDQRIRFRLQPRNLGMVAHWNWCLAAARGQYVKFLFGDDRLAGPTALAQLVGLLDAHPSAVLAASPRYVIDERSRVLRLLDAWGRPGLHAGTDVIRRCLMRNGNLVGEPSAVLFRRHAAGRGFSPAYRHLGDEEMWFSLLEQGAMAFASEPLCCFRRHALQQTEVNLAQEVGKIEGLQLVKDYRARPYLGKRTLWIVLGSQLYDLRKNRRRHGPSPFAGVREMERLLTRWVGRSWYGAYWVRRRIRRPFENLLHWLRRLRNREHCALVGTTYAGSRCGRDK